MTRDDVIRWAREAGLNTWHCYPPIHAVEQWQRFAALVAAAERAACASECAAMHEYDRPGNCADAIRARGK